MKRYLLAAVAALSLSTPVYAGPFILDGTDADDHGFASGGANQGGWLYIQKGLENIAAGASLSRTQKTIAVLGSDLGGEAANAVQSAVALSALSAAGWSVVLLNDSEISDFFNNAGGTLDSSNASVIYMDSTSNNVGGGLSGSEQTIIDGFATEINNFVGSGGGLFTHSQGYGWLSALIPGLTVFGEAATGISLTAAGNSSFPGLADADLSTGPYHSAFSNTGIVPILGRGTASGNAIILGGAGGSIIDPNTGGVPEPAAWAMMLTGFGLVGGAMRRRPSVKVSFAA
jgi:hypothetical protein